jgi:protein-S-isoprenylcysteine O-methyltransferase Ste14
MHDKSVNTYLVFAGTMVAVAAASFFSQPWGLLLSMICVVALALETLILRLTHREVLKRRIHLHSWWDAVLTPLIALCAVASAALCAYDATHAGFSQLPFWCFFLGIIILMSALLIFVQSLKSYAPHAAEKYGEDAPKGGERGPYEVIRHPIMLSVLLGGLSIPLIMTSGIGFIPAGVMLVAIVAKVAAEDDWRFNTYEWFYDYTKEVPYRLIPFIW